MLNFGFDPLPRFFIYNARSIRLVCAAQEAGYGGNLIGRSDPCLHASNNHVFDLLLDYLQDSSIC